MCIYILLLQGPEFGIIISNKFNLGEIFLIIRIDPKYLIKVLGI